jgi:hypothetical protein
MPRIYDSSKDIGEKMCFPNIDPKGFAEQEEIKNPKPKPKSKGKQKAPDPATLPPKDFGSLRPKTTDNPGKRRIDLLRRFHGDLIGTKSSNMEHLNNVFVASGGQDVISLSVYNNS